MSIIQNWVDSFKRAPDEYGADPDYAGDGCEKEGKPEILGDENYGNAERFVETDDHRMVAVPEKSGLKRTLDNRHVQFIALGGASVQDYSLALAQSWQPEDLEVS